MIAKRCAIDLGEANRREEARFERGTERSAAVAARPAPEHERFQLHFRQAFAQAVRTLEARERALLRLHFVEGDTLERLGLVYGVHRSTVTRWVAVARATALSRTRKALAEALEATPSEITSLLRAAGSGLDASISALFNER